MTYTCPKDPTHQSTDPDYCSECGAKIAGQPSSSSQTVTTSLGAFAGQLCPDCGTPRSGTAKFCEVCRYNFELGVSSGAAVSQSTANPVPTSASVVTAPIPDVPTDAAPITPVIPNYVSQKLDAVVTVDESLYTNPDPAVPCPTDSPELVFPLDFPENLIGRRSSSQGNPEVPVRDPGVSHRHAKLLIENGQVYLLELGSTNGTLFNNSEVLPGAKTLLGVGDSFTLGCWTRITIRAR